MPQLYRDSLLSPSSLLARYRRPILAASITALAAEKRARSHFRCEGRAEGGASSPLTVFCRSMWAPAAARHRALVRFAHRNLLRSFRPRGSRSLAQTPLHETPKVCVILITCLRECRQSTTRSSKPFARTTLRASSPKCGSARRHTTDASRRSAPAVSLPSPPATASNASFLFHPNRLSSH
jgi:hypothetical protein